MFSISSQDQGWGGSSDHHGTYAHSYTWFDAVREPWYPPDRQPLEPAHPLLPQPNTLQCNALAFGGPITHEITWSYLDSLDADSDRARQLAESSGRGRETMNGEFVRQMKVGDSVALWAKARFPGWENNVHNAEVKVFWAV
jgi:hypothetical protein